MMIQNVKLLTEQFLEIEFAAENAPTDCEEAGAQVIGVSANGVAVHYGTEAYFDHRLTLKLAGALKNPADAEVCVQLACAYRDTDPSSAAETEAEASAAEIRAEVLTVPAVWAPWYTFTRTLSEDATAPRRNQGTKSKLWVLGNESSGCPSCNPRYTAEYVIQYCAEGINKVAGRSDFLTLAAARNGLSVVVVGDGVSVYEVPEYRHLYNEADAMTRVTIPGTRELPLIVTTARDVMRQKTENNDTFEMLYQFAKLYWELGVKDGSPMFALSVYDDEDTYNYVKHLEQAWNHAKEQNLWPETKMQESPEEYFAWATLVWYGAIGESADGSWQTDHFPVNTRCEMLEYDPTLYGVLVEIYGEFEYFSGYIDQHTVNKDRALREDFPWYKHSQRDCFGIDGKPYEPLKVTECHLISANQIELIFNREVRDLDELRRASAWTVTWEKTDGSVVEFRGAAENSVVSASQTENKTDGTAQEENAAELNSEKTDKGQNADHVIRCLEYQWKTLTLEIPDVKLYRGYIGSDITGFTFDEIREAGEPDSINYKPWFRTNARKRTLDGVVLSPYRYEKAIESGRKPCPDSDNPIHEYTIAPTFTVKANPGAIEKGTYVNFADENTIPDGLKGGIAGKLTVRYDGHADDWSGNELSPEPITVTFRPWLSQVMRSARTGVYVYGDPYVKKSSLALTCIYWDMLLSNERRHIGQRIADGLAYAHGGAELMSYHHHAYQMSGMRTEMCGRFNHFFLYVEGFGGGICQTTEANVVRDYTYTRYDNEFILGHEGAHSIEITGMPYFTDLNALVEEAYEKAVVERNLWNHGGISYCGSNRAEYFATLSNIWHSTMRESTDGTNNGTWLPINTREELYEYDRFGYEMCKRTYYNGRPGVNAAVVNRAIAEDRIHLQDEEGKPILHYEEDMFLPGWDKDWNSINDDVIRWGSTFPVKDMREADRFLSRIYGEDTYFRWVSWSTANQWDINDDHDPASGVRYGESPKARYEQVNYNPYLEK